MAEQPNDDVSSESGAKRRPPGPDQAPFFCPQGIDKLLRKAASDPVFRDQLLQHRAGAAAAIGLELDPAEKAMLDSIPSAQLLLTIEQMEMTRDGRRGFLMKLGVAAAALASAGGLWLWLKREPSYEGKGLSEWLRLAERYGWSYNPLVVAVRGAMAIAVTGSSAGPGRPVSRVPQKPEMTEVEAALRAMGTNAVPSMLAMLEMNDPAWKLKLIQWMGKQSVVKIPFTKAATCQKRALIGLTVLGPLATNAMPVIQKAMADTNRINDWEFQA